MFAETGEESDDEEEVDAEAAEQEILQSDSDNDEEAMDHWHHPTQPVHVQYWSLLKWHNLRLLCGSYKLIFLHYFTMFCI